METNHGYPYRGYVVVVRTQLLDSGRSSANFTVQEGEDGKGEVRYTGNLGKEDFATDVQAKDRAIAIATDWIDKILIPV